MASRPKPDRKMGAALQVGVSPPMLTASYNQPTEAAVTNPLRRWALPVLTAALVLTDLVLGPLNSMNWTALAALAIAVCGLPHGTLDVEIAALRFGAAGAVARLKILAIYLSCAALMALCWWQVRELALTLFLILSIIHFSQDWRGRAEPFLALLVAWTLVALPALTKPAEVAAIFNILTGNQHGSVIAAVLACATAPALVGSVVFVYWSYHNGDRQNAVDVVCCLVAALLLPPLLAFAIFFCGLHSPRHMAEALRETGAIPPWKRFAIIGSVFLLSVALGILLLIGQNHAEIGAGVIRSAFMLISILTVPHFLLEQVLPIRPHAPLPAA